MDASDDQPLITEGSLIQLADPAVGVVSDRLPGVVGDQRDPRGDVAVHRDADRVFKALHVQPGDDLLVRKPRVGAQQDLPAAPARQIRASNRR